MLKVAYVGGGSLFLPSILNGLAHEARALREAGQGVHLALHDVSPERAERMARYAAIVAKGTGTALSASVTRSLAAAIDGAGLAYLSISHPGLHEGWKALGGRLRLEPHGEGPARTAYEGATIFATCLPIGEEMRKRAPRDAVFATLVNPTDVLAGAFERRFGFRSVGVCCEVGGLIGMLGHHLGHRFDDFALRHVGINHMGWVLDLRIRGEDAYPLVRERLPEIARQPGFHPGCHMLLPILRLTGHLRSSAYHRWPHEAGEGADWASAMRPWAGKRERRQKALDAALATGQPIADDEPTHPEASVLQYRELGRQIGQMMAAMAAGEARVVPLQVRNDGATAQLPAGSVVEVPTRVAGTALQPLDVGEAPEWLIASERSFALSRALTSEWLAEPTRETLHKALGVLPMFGPVEDVLAFADALHAQHAARERHAQ